MKKTKLTPPKVKAAAKVEEAAKKERHPFDDLTRNWRKLIEFLREGNEPDVWRLLQYEMSHRKRHTVALRVFGRANELRTQRERSVLLSNLSKAK